MGGAACSLDESSSVWISGHCLCGNNNTGAQNSRREERETLREEEEEEGGKTVFVRPARRGERVPYNTRELGGGKTQVNTHTHDEEEEGEKAPT